MTIKMYDLCGTDAARRFSPYCWRIRMSLAHKGLAVDTVAWRFTETEAIAFSGSATVPVIVDGDRVVSDSWKIAEYLDETYPDAAPLFASADAKGQAMFIKNWVERQIHPILLKMILLDVYDGLGPEDQSYFRESREKRFGATLEQFCANPEASIPEFGGALAPLRATLQSQPFICGDRPAFGDYIVFGTFQWARVTSKLTLLEENDPVYNWLQRILDLFDGLGRSVSAKAALDRVS